MRLKYTTASPYARKVQVMIREKQIEDRVELSVTAPFAAPADLIAVNPLSKVPALQLGDGSVLYDSRVICEYLDELAPQPRLIPTGAERWPVLRRQALADGVMDAGILALLETRRPDATQRSVNWIDTQLKKVDRALDALDGEDLRAEAVDLGNIAIACALGWLDFRYPDLAWRAARPKLAAFANTFAERPSMRSTMPAA